jgi:hypothetical protein
MQSKQVTRIQNESRSTEPDRPVVGVAEPSLKGEKSNRRHKAGLSRRRTRSSWRNSVYSIFEARRCPCR